MTATKYLQYLSGILNPINNIIIKHIRKKFGASIARGFNVAYWLLLGGVALWILGVYPMYVVYIAPFLLVIDKELGDLLGRNK